MVQYDNLKFESEAVKVRSNAAKPSSRMLGAINILESERLMKKFPWEAFAVRGSQLENGTRPDDATDVLFDSSHGVALRPVDPGRRLRQPKIHFGRIGAANILLKDRSLRDLLRKEHSIVAIEMEGSGIADAAWNAGQQYIVIRGICDYCDNEKNDDWQGYAAVTAAAYARAVISIVNPGSYQIGEIRGHDARFGEAIR